jgi:hypothetical protein
MAAAMAPEIATNAIIAAVSAGATDTAKSAIADAYQGLKSLIKEKFGHGGAVAEAIDMLEAKPNSTARKMLVAEELRAVTPSVDAELVSAAQSLLTLIKTLPQGEQHIQLARSPSIYSGTAGQLFITDPAASLDGHSQGLEKTLISGFAIP